jgi:dienelactone hydrolase
MGRSRKVDHLLLTPVKIQSSDGLWITGQLWQRPINQPLPAIIWMQEKETGYNALANYACRQLAEVGNVVLDLDVRGMGPVEEAWLDFVPLQEANMTYDAFLLGRPILGMRVADALRAAHWLGQQKFVQPGRIGAVGRGYGALVALLSAGVDERIGMVVEMEGLASWSGLTWNRCYDWPVSFILPGVLPWMDLDTIRSSLAPRLQVVVAPQDHLHQAMTREQIDVEFEAVRKAYAKQKAPGNLLLLHDKSDLSRLSEQLAGR